MEAKEFGRFIAGMRKEKKMTQAELAEKIHVTDKAVSRWERGVSLPDIQTIEPLAQALGISVLELMRSERQEKAKEEAAPEIQYTQKEVAEMLQNAGDISRQQKKQDRNANVIAGFLVIGVAAAAWAAKIVNVGGGLILGGLVAAAFVSLWYFFQNLDDEESRKVYGADIHSVYRHSGIPGKFRLGRSAGRIHSRRSGTKRADLLDPVVSVCSGNDDDRNHSMYPLSRDRKKKRNTKPFFSRQLWRRSCL
ncbi:MAG: helix-turn-helix domain-containing protein [Blautia sp.]